MSYGCNEGEEDRLDGGSLLNSHYAYPESRCNFSGRLQARFRDYHGCETERGCHCPSSPPMLFFDVIISVSFAIFYVLLIKMIIE